MSISGGSIGSTHSSTGEQKVTLVLFLGGITYAEIAALRFLSQQDDGNFILFTIIQFFI